MSKKVVPFTLPPTRQPDHPAETLRSATGDAKRVSDAWVFEGQPQPPPAADPPPQPQSTAGNLLIDLSAPRTPIEWMSLIWGFPYVAGWAWTAQILQAVSAKTKS